MQEWLAFCQYNSEEQKIPFWLIASRSWPTDSIYRNQPDKLQGQDLQSAKPLLVE